MTNDRNPLKWICIVALVGLAGSSCALEPEVDSEVDEMLGEAASPSCYFQNTPPAADHTTPVPQTTVVSHASTSNASLECDGYVEEFYSSVVANTLGAGSAAINPANMPTTQQTCENTHLRVASWFKSSTGSWQLYDVVEETGSWNSFGCSLEVDVPFAGAGVIDRTRYSVKGWSGCYGAHCYGQVARGVKTYQRHI